MFFRTGSAVANRHVDEHGIVLTVRVDPAVAAATEPGHFFMVRRPGSGFPLLSRPFSIFAADRATGDLSFLYEVIGQGTALLAALRPGDPVTVLGPLGNAFEPDETADRHVMVAGGVGIAPFLSLAKRIARPDRTLVLFGARDAGRLIGAAEFEKAGVSIRLATDDGSRGHRGTSVDLLRAALAGRGPAERWQIYACGPNPMLRAVAAVTVPGGLPCQVSLEARMACGFGACVGCAFPVRSTSAKGYRYALVCREGTVFDAAELDFERAGAS